MAINQRGFNISKIKQRNISLARVYHDSFLVYDISYETFTLEYFISTWGISSVVVNRTSSPKAGASTGQLNSGDDIYTDDVLSVTITATGTNYFVYNDSERDLSTYTYQIVVDDDVIIGARAVVRSYTSVRVTTGSVGTDTPEGIRYIGNSSVSVTNGFTSGVFAPWAPTPLSDKIEVTSSTSSTINYRGLSVNPNTTVRGTIYYYNNASAISKPVITSATNHGNYFTFVIQNNNSVSLDLRIKYWYLDSSSDDVDVQEMTQTTMSANTSYTYNLYSTTGAEITDLNFYCRYYNSSTGQYTDYQTYEY